MPEINTYDYELLAAFIVGTLTLEQQKAVQERISSEPDFDKLYRQLLFIYSAYPAINTFDTEKALRKVHEIAGKKKSKIHITPRTLFYSAAAAVIILIALTLANSLFLTGNKQINYILVASTDSVHVTSLSDGSTATLNKNSILRYESGFENSELRRVELEGEAFFEVKHDATKPFVVVTQAAEVLVTGTAFSVNDFSGKEVVVWVEQGSVSVTSATSNQTIHLNPGEKAICNKTTGSISKTYGSGDETFWKSRFLSFTSTPLSDACITLEKNYGCSFEITGSKLHELTITASFENEEPEHILEVIAITLGLQLEASNNHYRLYAE